MLQDKAVATSSPTGSSLGKGGVYVYSEREADSKPSRSRISVASPPPPAVVVENSSPEQLQMGHAGCGVVLRYYCYKRMSLVHKSISGRSS